MKKNFSLILLALMMVLVLVTCVACGEKEPPAPTTYTVTIDLQDGSEPTTQTVEAGGTVNFPQVTPPEYKSFKGWYTSPDGKSGQWKTSDTVSADVTIYAVWNSSYTKVTFNLNYPKSPKATTKNVAKGEKITANTFVAERECYIFAGWYLDAACTQAFDMNSAITGLTTLYASWTLDPNHVHEYTKSTVAMNCEKDGYDSYTCKCGDTYTDNIVPASGHDFTFHTGDYFGMVTCNNENCNKAARLDSERIYDDVFVYTFDADRQASIEALYASILDMLSKAEPYDQAHHAYNGDKTTEYYLANQAFEELYDAFYDEVMYVTEQYQYAYVFYCVDENTHTEAYETISEYRINMISDFYAIYRLVYETQFREFFFDKIEGGWTDEDIAQALTMSDTYGGEEYSAINTRISEIEVAFREFKDPDKDDEAKELGVATVPELYEEFVSLKNQMANLAGYDSYTAYAYENEYSRDYTPEDVAKMRGYVKQYLRQAYATILSGYKTANTDFASGTDAAKYYAALAEDSVFDSKVTTDLVKEYFSIMNTEGAAQDIDFLFHANELFKNGNYFTGSYSGAFNYWIGAQETSILYFGPGSYSGAFTFVHEFGHYYADKYTNGISMSYDLAETHSQGDEMLFLSYVEDHLPKEVLREIYPAIYYDNLFNMFAIIMLATAVDEFEYCVYNNVTPDGQPTTYKAKDYDKLFLSIMSSYGIAGSLNSSYWRFVVIEAPCYYISYAMSALPCVELLAVAETEGFDTAQDIYFKFYTFTDDPANVEVDEYGDKTITIGYGETLEYVGLHSIFDEGMYETLSNYFTKAEKDFTYPDAE